METLLSLLEEYKAQFKYKRLTNWKLIIESDGSIILAHFHSYEIDKLYELGNISNLGEVEKRFREILSNTQRDIAKAKDNKERVYGDE